jgi:hypothetical protein
LIANRATSILLRGWLSVCFAIGAALASPSPAEAEPPSALLPKPAADRAAVAEALFDQGKRLMLARRFAEACSRFAESERVDHGVGTLLNLADCYEQNGQTASAWAEFRTAAAAASDVGQVERERIARDRERRLLPLLARLTIVIPREQAAAGLIVRRDDLVLDPSLWGMAAPIDPGEHTLVVSAPGKRPYTRTIAIPARAGARVTAVVPPLADLPARASSPPAAPAPHPGLRSQQIAGFAVAGVGLAGLVVGSTLGLSAIARNNSAASHCRGDLCDQQGVALRSDALRAGTASTVAFIAAGAVLAGGATIYFTTPNQGRASASATVGLTPSGGSFFLGARW